MSWRSKGRRPKVEEPREYYFPLRGGLDLTSPPYSIDPGKLIDCYRYEIAPSGGLKPIDGFERVDGQGLPSEAVYQCLEFQTLKYTNIEHYLNIDHYIYSEDQDPVPTNTTITGATSGATGVSVTDGTVVFGDDDELQMISRGVFLLTSGVFQDGEQVLVDGVPYALVSTAYIPNSETSDEHESYYKWLVVEFFRSRINKVPGSGPVRGVWRYNGTLYAFRDNEDATACVMYKEDLTNGWANVGGLPSLSPGGAYKFINTNFGGSASTVMMYGCDGKNKAFQFDGSTFTQITTGMADDAPIDIYEHKKHLFLAFPNGSLQHSPPTDPTGTWSVVVDAGELGMGEEITNILGLPGGALGIWCKDSIHILYGSTANTSSEDIWQLEPYSKESGAIAGTVQAAGKTLFLNNTGIANLEATSAYGGFKSGTISSIIQPLLDMRKGNAVGSVVIASKNQYRIFFEDGYWITVSLSKSTPEFTQANYEKIVRCISAPKRATDEPGAVYFGSDDGYVYKMDSGVSLDDKPMLAYARLPYSHQGYPRRKKRYREMIVELDQFGSNEVHLSFSPDFSFSRSDVPEHGTVEIHETTSGAGLWDVSEWDNFSWTGGDIVTGGGGTAAGDIEGIATEMGMMLYFEALNTVTPLHILNGVFYYYNFLGRQS